MIRRERVRSFASFAICLVVLSGCATWDRMWSDEGTDRVAGGPAAISGSYGSGRGAGGTVSQPYSAYDASACTDITTSASRKSEPHARMRLEGLPPVSPSAASAINALLGGTVEAALRGDTATVAAKLVPEDHNRVANISGGDLAAMQRASREFDNNWNSRYGSAFSWNQSMNQQAFGSYQISKGENDNLAQVVVPPVSGVDRSYLILRDQGNNMWRINSPDALSGTKLKDRIYSALTDLNNSRNDWPANSADASRFAAAKILSIFTRS